MPPDINVEILYVEGPSPSPYTHLTIALQIPHMFFKAYIMKMAKHVGCGHVQETVTSTEVVEA